MHIQITARVKVSLGSLYIYLFYDASTLLYCKQRQLSFMIFSLLNTEINKYIVSNESNTPSHKSRITTSFGKHEIQFIFLYYIWLRIQSRPSRIFHKDNCAIRLQTCIVLHVFHVLNGVLRHRPAKPNACVA